MNKPNKVEKRVEDTFHYFLEKDDQESLLRIAQCLSFLGSTRNMTIKTADSLIDCRDPEKLKKVLAKIKKVQDIMNGAVELLMEE